MAADLELCYKTATSLAAHIARGEISAKEVIENSLARIEEVNPKLNCFCFVFPEEARAQAAAADDAQARGERLKPLHGVPVAIKDLTPTKGHRTTRGSKIFEHWVADFDPVIVQRLKAAGAILIGKTTTPEFAFSSFTHSPLWGVTRNPWDRSRTPGGSSGGSGAAVASGCVPLAEGTDMGGSVRIPAAWCGIVGLKPSLGRIPMDILPSVFDNISHFGPLTRSAVDAALFLETTQGPHDADINSLPDAPSYLDRLDTGVVGRRFALSMDQGFYAVDDEIEDAVLGACDALKSLGATVETVDLPWRREICDAWSDCWDVFMAAYFGDHLEEWHDRMDPEVVQKIERGRKLSAVGYKRQEILRTEQWRTLVEIFQEFDGLLCPTNAQAAPKVEDRDWQFGQDDPQGRYHGLDMTMVFNFVGACPAISVPAGFTPNGLPVGLQIVGRRHDDLFVLQAAHALEQADIMKGRRPDV